MKHAPDDEPVFLLRAKDKAAPNVIREWARQHRQNGGGWSTAENAIRQAEAMEAWQREHGSQLADTLMSHVIYVSEAPPELSVTAFHGGRARGACLQFDGDIAQLPRGEVLRLVEALKVWLDREGVR